MIFYDQVWQTFLDNYKASDIDIPQDNEKIYQHIQYAVRLFNNRMGKSAKCDDASETITEIHSDNDLLIISHYIRLTFLKNDLTYFEKLWQPFAADVGIRNMSTQIKSLNNSTKDQEDFIERIIFNSMEEFL